MCSLHLTRKRRYSIGHAVLQPCYISSLELFGEKLVGLFEKHRVEGCQAEFQAELLAIKSHWPICPWSLGRIWNPAAAFFFVEQKTKDSKTEIFWHNMRDHVGSTYYRYQSSIELTCLIYPISSYRSWSCLLLSYSSKFVLLFFFAQGPSHTGGAGNTWTYPPYTVVSHFYSSHLISFPYSILSYFFSFHLNLSYLISTYLRPSLSYLISSYQNTSRTPCALSPAGAQNLEHFGTFLKAAKELIERSAQGGDVPVQRGSTAGCSARPAATCPKQ